MDPFNPKTAHSFTAPQNHPGEDCEGWDLFGLTIGAVTSTVLAGSFFAMLGYQVVRGVSRLF